MRRVVRAVGVVVAVALAAEGAEVVSDRVVRPAAAVSQESDVAERPDAVSAAIAARAQHRRVLVTDLTTERSQTFANPDGTQTEEQSLHPVRVQKDGEWVPVDTTLVPDSTGVRPRAAVGDLVLSSGGTSLPLMSGSFGTSRSLAIRWPGPLPEPVLTGDTATYRDVLANADLVVTASGDGVEFSVVLRAAPPRGTFPLRLPVDETGVSLSVGSAGGLTVHDAASHSLVGGGATPLVFDATAGTAGDAHHARLPMSVDAMSSGRVLTLSPDTRVFTDMATLYPVTVDPALSFSVSSDTYIQASNPNTNYNGSGFLRTGASTVAPTNDKSRSMITLTTSSFTGAHVTAATLNLYNFQANLCDATGSGTNTNPAYVYDITSAWAPSTVTWNAGAPTYSNSIRAQSSMARTGLTGCGGAYVNFAGSGLTSVVHGWANGSSNYGVLVKSASETDAVGFRHFYSKDHAGGGPSWSVTYNRQPATVAGRYVASANTAADWTRYARSSTPTLGGSACDPEGSPVRIDYEVYNASNALVASSSTSRASVASCADHPWTVPTPLADGTYTWRARAWDGTDYSKSWSSNVTMVVDTVAPSIPTISTGGNYVENTWNTGGVDVVVALSSTSTDVAGYDSGYDDPDMLTFSGDGAPIYSREGPHTYYARAVDRAGNKSATRTYWFGIGDVGMTTPVVGARTQKTFTLDAQARPTWTEATWYWRRASTDTWQQIADSWLRFADGSAVTQPLAVVSGDLPAVTFDAASQVQTDGAFEISLVAAAPAVTPTPPTPVRSPARSVSLDRTDFGSVTATAPFGPGSVNLLTGNLQVATSDVSVGALSSDLTMSRTFNSRDAGASANGPFGPGWVASVPVVSASSVFDSLVPSGSLVTVTLAGGDTITFSKADNAGSFTPEYGSEHLKLAYKTGDVYEIRDEDGNVTSFTKPTGAVAYVPTSVVQASSTASTTYSYETVTIGGSPVTRVTAVMAPPPISGCSLSSPFAVVGCRSLRLTYAAASVTPPGSGQIGDYPQRLKRVEVIAYDPALEPSPDPDPSTPSATAVTAVSLAEYAYDSTGRLREVWDPRLSPTLKTSYTYDSGGRLATVTPAGEAAWTLAYGDLTGESGSGRVRSVSRAAPTATSQTATTTVVYGVPLSGTGAPWDLSPSQLDRTGQHDRPVTGTAVFPANTATGLGTDPNALPATWDRATVHYLDADGREVNTADPAGAISTVEHDARGAVIRGLTPGNRQRAFARGASAVEEAAIAETLSTRTTYSADGLLVLERFAPEHDVMLSGGEVVRARPHTTWAYDEGAPAGSSYNLETTVTSGARVAGETSDRSGETRVAKTEYGTTTASWALGLPTARITDAGGANLTVRSTYMPDGRIVTSTLPAGGTSTNTAATRVTRYYTASAHPDDAACGNKPQWAEAVCSIGPGGQPTSGPPVPTQYTTSYDMLMRPLTVVEKAGTTTLRTTDTRYDPAGRVTRQWATASTGTALPTVETTYDANGRLDETRSLDAYNTVTAYVKRTYNALGMITSYRDADAVTSTLTYDLVGRPLETYDGQGTQTWTYDGGSERRGLPTSLTDTHVSGTISATYDLDGTPTVQWPNGIEVGTTVDEVGTTRSLTYTKTGCTADCTWASSSVVESVHGQWRSQTTGVSDEVYSYDATGRLTQVQDTVGGSCTTRKYTFDGGSVGNSNRTKLETFDPASDASCQTATASTAVNSTYDAFDRITTSGTVYDSLGRTTTVPDSNALDGGDLSVTYYVNDLVASISQAGAASKSYTLDVDQQRVRSWVDGGVTHTNHYDGDGDNPAWTQESASAWTRNIGGIAGDLAAVRDSATSETTWQIVDLHGDVVGTASSSTSATAPTATFDADEYGIPDGGTGRRYGWLGSKQRAADTPGGLLLMGARLYNPATGRFLQVDPVWGGSANAYDYAMQDPLNNLDLDGRAVERNDGCAVGGQCDQAMREHWKTHPPPYGRRKCGWLCKKLRVVAKATVIVAIVVALSWCTATTGGLCATAFSTVMTSMAIGAAGGVALHAVDGGKGGWRGYASAAGWGALSGGANGFFGRKPGYVGKHRAYSSRRRRAQQRWW